MSRQAKKRFAKRQPTTPRAPEHDLSRKPAVAVMPFDNMSGDPNQEYFADGITEDIITALSRSHWLSVIARNSTFALKGRSSDVRLVARELDADYLVEGSVRRRGNRVRITAQLIDGASGTQIWAERYDRDIADIFAVQDEVTGTIAARIEPELGAVERQRAERKPTQNLDAWDCYHLGLSHMYRFNKDANLEAQRLFRSAIAFDRKFAAAHARLAYCIVLEMVYFDALPTRESLDQALAIARTAVSLDDKDAFCHQTVGRVHLARREYLEALARCRTAIDLNPSLAQAYCSMGEALVHTGRVEEAIPWLEEAIRLSPHDPWRWAFFSYLAKARILLGHCDKAVESAQAALRIPNCQYWANAHLVAALGHLGKKDEARSAVAELLGRKADFSCRYAEEHLFYIESRVHLEHYLEGLRKAGVPELTATEPGPPEAKRPEKNMTDEEASLVTPREQQVMTLITRGLANREIAFQLGVTERTAETHVRNILNKLKVNSRTQIALWAVAHGLHSPSAID